MSSLEIEDVLASIRRLVSDDLRPANRPNPVGKLMLTPALRVVPPVAPVNAADAPLDRPSQTVVPDAVAKPARATLRDGWVPDRTTLAAMGAEDADHLDFGGGMGADAPLRSAAGPSALQTAAEGFHAETDEFILSYSDTGTVMLHTDVAPVPPEPTDHGAVFAVLHNGQGPVRVPPVQALVDAEGGAPVEDETGWSTVAWDDAPAAADPAAQATAEVFVHDDTAAQGPLILPFVSARRAPAGDVLTLRSPVLHVMTPVADRTAEDAPTEALILKRSRPRMTANHLAAQDQAAARADTVPAEGTAAPSGDELAAATAGHATTGATSAQTALGAASDSAGSSVGPREGQADAAPEMAPEAVAISDRPVADLAGTAIAATAGPVADAGAIAADAKAGAVPQEGTDAAAFGHLPATAAMAAPATRVRGKAAVAEAAVIDTLAETLKSAGSRGKPPATLADAAFTRWPGWAQSGAGPQPDSPSPSSPETPAVAAQGRKPKAAAQDLGWADRAEAEIHRQLAAELGPSVIRDVAAPAPGLQLSEAALRDLVRDMIREELTGKLGERITQNVRKLVQMELQKTLSLNAGEFRSQRRDPD